MSVRVLSLAVLLLALLNAIAYSVLSERMQVRVSASAWAEPEKPLALMQEVAVEERARECAWLGPVTALTDIRADIAFWQPRLQQLTLHRGRSEIKAAWRVYLGPMPSMAEARAVVAQLQAERGLDAFVVRKGYLRAAVSLGNFARLQGALDWQARLRAQGLAVDLAPVRDSGPWFWHLDGAKLTALAAKYQAHWQALAAGRGELETNAVFLEKKSCNTIASPNQFD